MFQDPGSNYGKISNWTTIQLARFFVINSQETKFLRSKIEKDFCNIGLYLGQVGQKIKILQIHCFDCY